jgi:myo-inositol-1(or 4)-monophosphatase
LNRRSIHVSARKTPNEALVSLGFGQGEESLEAVKADFQRLTNRVRKLRIMGSAALALAYVADGRFDAYIETGVRIWDVAAGGLIVECAGGEFWRRSLPGEHRVAVVASNGLLRAALE